MHTIERYKARNGECKAYKIIQYAYYKKEEKKDCCSLIKNRPLSFKDTATVIRAAGYSPSNVELKHIIDTKMGTTYTHQLFDLKTIQELCTGIKKRSEREVHDSLRCFDYERNGFVSEQELQYFLSTRGEKLTDEEIDGMLRDMDIDGQGMLSIEQALSVPFVGDYTE
ncbi:unnamed protein product [Didymodactylos carnosus]|uniref:EF-hand domain-containing protein n=1 Tax=Didymodactylos carnosus TaxID=1234261 RepID=A0A816ATY7_9BILA|nr:unnamed protein product [Didymodactylos carnosus]CAF1601367.1 unnamed protein product [Didymodactylos carnosus]CAF4069762.1 unnamed protein product [Didymodactylos carnosus]CAF4478588.1 unnamed protein product [Didymodactylos carnosus]